ncbi:MAG: TetR/AcrR family transcriptional regulator [Woeseiaceae bacterium]
MPVRKKRASKKHAPKPQAAAVRGDSARPATPRRLLRPGARPPAQRAPGFSYHHGDLRQALLDATEKLLESAGLEGFTLREVARRAGVSHGAPAHHFGDARGLLSEFTAQSFADMAAAMKRHRERADGGAFEQLVAAGVAYVEYSLAHRARFQLMFRSDRLDWTRQALSEAGADAHGHLVECTTRIASEAGAPEQLTEDKIALAWSIVHGFATLLIDNRKFAEQVQGDSSRALTMLENMLRLSRPAFEARDR